jgi:hypothetical protein
VLGGPVTFNFNALSEGQGNGAVQSYLNSVWTGSGMSGTITVSGALAAASYNGENHVVGPVIGGSVVSLTLGTSDGGVYHGGAADTFIVNSGSDRITMTFPQRIFQVGFDYEIFPNGNVPDVRNTNPANFPDFTFIADGNQVFRTVSNMPGTNGILSFAPLDETSSVEVAPQFLGGSGLISLPGGATTIEFVDWPVMVGIDNLNVGLGTGIAADVVPEPPTAILFGVVGLGLLVMCSFWSWKGFLRAPVTG